HFSSQQISIAFRESLNQVDLNQRTGMYRHRGEVDTGPLRVSPRDGSMSKCAGSIRYQDRVAGGESLRSDGMCRPIRIQKHGSACDSTGDLGAIEQRMRHYSSLEDLVTKRDC